MRDIALMRMTEVRNNMDLKIKITQQPMEIPERDADKLEKEIQGRMSKDYWDDHIREDAKMVLIRG